MASFLILFSTFFFIFFTPQTASSAVICKTSYCGGGENPDVKFPFRLKHSPEACGYPGFDLSCNNRSQTILSLPYSGDFVVRDISYLGQSIFIGDQENCLFRRFLQNFSLSGSPFQFESSGTFTFFNCSANATEVYGFWPIPCLSGDDYVVFIAQSFFTQTLALPATCRAISRVPLPDLRLGSTVQLNWAVPICQGCEEQRGDCAIKNNTSLDVGCFNVPSNTGGLPRSANYGIAIGLGVPGILSVIGVSCYLCGLVRIHTRRRRLNTELSSSITLQRNVVSTGLDGPTIESYPKTLLGESRRLPKPNDNTCPICLSEYLPKEELRTIPDCHHYFHAKCVDEWLRMNATCPLCRNSPDSSAAVTPSSLSTSSSPSSSLVAV